MSVKSKTEDLEAFVTVVDCGSFSRAAVLLDQHIAKVSRAITRLETSLECALLSRTTRRLELTEEGQTFIEYAREGLNLLEHGEESLRLLKHAPAGKLRVDAASPFVLHQLTPLIAQFSHLYPDIRLDITSHDNVIDLLEHKTDLAIRIGQLPDSNLHARKLGISQLHLVASPAYLKQSSALNTELDLYNHKLIGFTGTTKLNKWPLQQACALNFSLNASSGETIRHLCIAGQGIALLSQFMIADDLTHNRLIKVLPQAIKTPNQREPVQAVYYKNSAVSSRIAAFLDFIQPRLTL
ncbi:LysR family transcriptional regulator [Pseudoalteromonas sp. NEC-BIFX-2020_015]|uniref:LysR family transcriptional regulator n=1 Tax=Pseudoalteromonas sp. NEC-BIFX-2020_015 TaxID=2729544 RepID=UPI00146160A8|nr:LysR family transcriptional regulator [Pseudoalteromonas sp. NEC-BIFX-2020_015]NMR25694.1 LysR family transcriptional regulator [Pseudoalteromonas sp. NEC-BIFX-2020_015]